MSSETELINRAQRGDREAFCLLAHNYERRIYSLALHYCRNPHDAEDLSQEVWLKAYKAIGGFRGESGFYTWLRQITIHTFLNDRREMKAMLRDKKAIVMGQLVTLDDLGLDVEEPAQSPEMRLHQQMMVDKVMEGLDELSPQQRLFFLLKHREGMTYEEIAEACAVSAGTVKKSLFRSLARLREFLGIRLAPESYVSSASGENH